MSGVDWSGLMLTPDGFGFFSFPGGNVTFNGVSLGSTAIYRTSVDYRVNGGLMLESVCLNNMWTPSATIVAGKEVESGKCGVVRRKNGTLMQRNLKSTVSISVNIMNQNSPTAFHIYSS